MDSGEQRHCECGAPQRCVADPHIPVEFDAEMNEYHLVREGGRTVMQYCFWCGGRLPESKRGDFFTTPDEAEMAEVETLLKDAKSHDDVVRILGQPDSIKDAGGFTRHGATGAVLARWNQSYEYTSRWKSLVVSVPVIVEGQFTYRIKGHYLGRKVDSEPPVS